MSTAHRAAGKTREMTADSTFWGRRRAAVKAEEEAAAARQAPEEIVEEQLSPEKSDADILAELGLPDPDTMDKGDDFAAFMMQAVPEHIRKRALRKLWRSNPVLACVDGLNDYDDDYLTGSYGNASIKTSYQVGKGLLKHVLELAEQEAETAKQDAESKACAKPLDKHEKLTETVTLEDPAPVAGAVLENRVEGPQSVAPRRMAFRFDRDDA